MSREHVGKTRSSNIELLKIAAIFLIIISHFSLTFSYFQDIDHSTNSAELFFVALSRYFGSIGNNIFFICSAWFLLDSKRNNKKKLLAMLLNVWAVSILILLAVMVLGHADLGRAEIMASLLPTTFSNNWYVTCYILFCLIYPILNRMIDTLAERQHLSCILFTSALAFVLHPMFNEWGGGYFYIDQLGFWILIFFILGYFKKYAPGVLDQRKINIMILLISLIGYIGLPLAVNTLGKSIPFFEGRLQKFNSINNIFLLGIAVSTFHLFRQIRIQSKLINKISSCTLYIYIIHENILLRSHYRPMVFEHIPSAFWLHHILLYIVLLSIATLILCTLLALLYQQTIQKAVAGMVDYSYPKLQKRWNHLLDSVQRSVHGPQ